MNKQNTLTLVESLLIDYANGTLPLALEVLVETHISMNPASAKSIRMLLQLGGALLENSDPISLSEGSFEKLMAEIDSGVDKDQEIYTNVSNDNNLLPLPLRNYAQDISSPKGRNVLALVYQSKRLILVIILVAQNYIKLRQDTVYQVTLTTVMR